MTIVTGTIASETLDGSLGADTITGAGGDDTINGSEGIDVAVYSGNAATYRFGLENGSLTITNIGGADGKDYVTGVELLRFADRDLGFASAGEFRVNVTTTDDQNESAVAALAGGGFVAVWTSDAQDGSGSGIYAQIYDATGIAKGAEFLVNKYTTDNQNSASVAAFGNGGFVVAWESSGQDGDQEGIYARRFDANGTAVDTNDIAVNLATTNAQYHPSAASLDSGGFVVSWYGDDASGWGVYARVFDNAGLAVTGDLTVNSESADDQFDSTVASLGDGVVVTWTSFSQEGVLGGQTGVYAQILDGNGDPVGGEFQVNLTTAGYQDSASACVLADGNIVIAWESAGQDGSGDGVYARRFAPDGTALDNTEISLNSTTANSQRMVSVSALEGGGFVAIWMSELQDGDGDGIFARIFGANGSPVSGELAVNTGVTGDQTRPSVAATADGGFVVSWESTGQDGNLDGVYARRFDANGADPMPAIVGTDAKDVLDLRAAGDLQAFGGAGNDIYLVSDTGDVLTESLNAGRDLVKSTVSYSLGDNLEQLTLLGSADIDGTGNTLKNALVGNSGMNHLFGAGGTDRLIGKAGADILEGGAGSDTLVGGAGKDTLDGGGNADLLKGGPGHDTYFVDSADTIVEFANGGNDTVVSTADWTLGNNLESLVLDGTARNGTGNGLANTITGNASANSLSGLDGNDRISGLGGADQLDGGNGNDTLAGDYGNDSLVGGAGNDVLTGGSGADSFVFNSPLNAASNVDVVTDFTGSTDVLTLDDDVFTAFNAGVSTTITSGNLYQGAGVTAAHDADDRIIYNSSTGALYYDADGNGGGAQAVLFAYLGEGSHPASLSAADFRIIA